MQSGMATPVRERPQVTVPAREPARSSGVSRFSWAFWVGKPWLVGVLGALVAAGLLSWNLARPALWLDESASVVATQRSWGNLWHLFGGDETPLLPFYILLKAFTWVLFSLWPALTQHPELSYRLLPALAAATAAGVLAAWLTRRAGLPVALTATAVLLSTSGFSRYGQEVRPYAFTLLLAIVASAVWWRMVHSPSAVWMPAYALSVGGLVCTHMLSGLLLPAHLLASVIAVMPGRRRRSFGLTLAGAALGLGLAAPFLTFAVHAHGATQAVPPTAASFFHAIASLIVLTPSEHFGLGYVIPALALIGLIDAVRPLTAGGRGVIARLAACWVLVPTALFVLAVLLKNNLLLGRYILFTLPGWSLLAGLGLLRCAAVAAAVLRSDLRPSTFGRPVVVRVLTGAALGAVLVTAQAPSLHRVRSLAGHGDDIRPALAAAQAPAVKNLPLMTNTAFGATDLSALAPGQEHRWIGLSMRRDTKYIWPTPWNSVALRSALHGRPAVGLLLRILPPDNVRDAGAGDRYLPTRLKRAGYRVETVSGFGTGWIFAVATATQP